MEEKFYAISCPRTTLQKISSCFTFNTLQGNLALLMKGENLWDLSHVKGNHFFCGGRGWGEILQCEGQLFKKTFT
jgi:hypothetical protein